MQGGFREPHESLVVLRGERAVQITVELVGLCSCQFSGLIASYASAYRNPTGGLGRALPGRFQVSLALRVVFR